MKRTRLFILTCLMTMLSVPVCAQAKTQVGSVATGASIPEYARVETIELSDDYSITSQIRNELPDDDECDVGDVQYKFILHKGNYEATQTIKLKSNVWICAEEGAVIELTGGTGRMFSTEYDGRSHSNIRITGGRWYDTRTESEQRQSMFVRLAHIRNLDIEDADFEVTERYNHILEFSDIDGMTISGCTISGNNYDTTGKKYSVQPKEAIQLDVATKSAMPKYEPFNSEGCYNVVIEQNTFENVARGVGSHGIGKVKKPYKNITVRNNTIQNTLGEGIFAFHWENSTIEGNTIKKCKRAGIYMESCKYDMVSGNKISSLKAYTGKRKSTYGKTYAGILYAITKNTTIKNNTLIQKSGSVTKNNGRSSKVTLKANKRKK